MRASPLGRRLSAERRLRHRTVARGWTRRGVLAAGAGGVALGTLALGVGPTLRTPDAVRRNGRLADEHFARRLPAIRAGLDAARPGFLFLAGNSHAELLGDALARRRPVVNGGIGGTSARRYAGAIDGLAFPVRAGIAVLYVGTNDILRRADPLSKRTLSGFEAAVTRILARLAANADRVWVAAVPPLGPEARAERDPAAVAAYSAILQALCARHGCRFFDPFAGLRDGESGLTTQATPPDGVHLRDYEGLAADLEARLPARDEGPSE